MAIMYSASLSLRFPDRDSRWRTIWPLEAPGGGAGVGGEVVLAGKPAHTADLRARAASLAGTSRTRSPSPTSRWASARPRPWAPSTAQQRCGQRVAHPRSVWWPSRVAGTRWRSSGRPCSSSAAAVWEALWGSTPIITGMRAPFSRADRDAGRAGRLGATADLCGATPGRVPAGPHNRSRANPKAAAAVVERPAGTLEPYGLQPQGSYPHSISRFLCMSPGGPQVRPASGWRCPAAARRCPRGCRRGGPCRARAGAALGQRAG
jgi:hypothetical protein